MNMRNCVPFTLVLALGLLLPAAGLAVEGDQALPESIILNPEETALSIRIWLDKGAYEAGERLTVHFAITQDCYVYIYDISSEGRVTLLFPNAFQPGNFLPAGQYTIPDERYSLIAEGKPGLEYLQAIASTRPIESLSFPRGADEEKPFPPIGLAPQALKAEVVKDLSAQKKGWAAAWASFYLLEPGRAWLIITSEPSGARVYLNGKAAGVTPLATSVRSGLVRVVLEKEGYRSWAARLYLERSEIEELTARLEEVILPPLPEPKWSSEPRLPLLGLGLGANLGLDWESLGMEVQLLPPLWLGAAARFTGEPVPDYYEVEPPEEPWPGERVYNSGPEIEFYVKLALPLRLQGRLALALGGGLAVQERVHLATPISAPEGPLPQDVTIKPNGYRTSESYLTALGGLIFKWEGLSLEVGYHSRRGLIFGGGLELQVQGS